MKSKEKGWVSNLLNWGRERQMSAHERLYGAAIEIARRPDLFARYGVSDDVDGRFDALALVVSLVMRRLKELGDDGRDLSQQLFDSMFADMDLSLREMGAGDLGVSKRVRVMAEAFMGRLDAYTTAIDNGDREALAEALERNLLRGADSPDARQSGLVDYVLALAAAVEAADAQEMLDGELQLGSVKAPR
ncbi:MAG: ubiquinol-cytochrome C chaperone family protein [Candidatus Puniceispirillaceae bacterium]|jgi:cytochrome b pre-mRNA-processing protein 3